MSRNCIIGLLLILHVVGASARGEEIGWLSDADQAWERSVSEGRPLLLFITRSNCKFCTQMKRETFADSKVKEQIQANFVPLAIDPKTDPTLIKEMKVTSFPTTLIISSDAVALDRIKGYLAPHEFQKRLTRSRAAHTARAPESSRLR